MFLRQTEANIFSTAGAPGDDTEIILAAPARHYLRIEHGIAKFFELKIDKLDTERASGPRAQNGGCDVHHVGHGHFSISAAVAVWLDYKVSFFRPIIGKHFGGLRRRIL